MTTVTTQNPVRTDLTSTEAGPSGHPTSGLWAVSGLGAALAGLCTLVTSGMVDVIYADEFTRGSVEGACEGLADKFGLVMAFHTFTTVGAVLMVVFGAGLFRRLRSSMRDSLAPVVALVGLAGTAVVSILGSGLDTEFAVPPAMDSEFRLNDGSAAMYNHWIATIPWLWTLVGLAGLAVYVAARARVVPRWQGVVGLVLGGLTVALGVSPFEYMAGLTRVLWLLISSIGFAVGDRAYRSSLGAAPENDARDRRRPPRPDARQVGAQRWAAPAVLAVPVACLVCFAVSVWLESGQAGPVGESTASTTPGWATALTGVVFGLCAAIVLRGDSRQGLGWTLAWLGSSGPRTAPSSPTCASAWDVRTRYPA